MARRQAKGASRRTEREIKPGGKQGDQQGAGGSQSKQNQAGQNGEGMKQSQGDKQGQKQDGNKTDSKQGDQQGPVRRMGSNRAINRNRNRISRRTARMMVGIQGGSGGSGEPGGAVNPQMSITGEAPEGDAANLEYARKQTDLVVE